MQNLCSYVVIVIVIPAFIKITKNIVYCTCKCDVSEDFILSFDVDLLILKLKLKM